MEIDHRVVQVSENDSVAGDVPVNNPKVGGQVSIHAVVERDHGVLCDPVGVVQGPCQSNTGSA